MQGGPIRLEARRDLRLPLRNRRRPFRGPAYIPLYEGHETGRLQV